MPAQKPVAVTVSSVCKYNRSITPGSQSRSCGTHDSTPTFTTRPTASRQVPLAVPCAQPLTAPLWAPFTVHFVVAPPPPRAHHSPSQGPFQVSSHHPTWASSLVPGRLGYLHGSPLSSPPGLLPDPPGGPGCHGAWLKPQTTSQLHVCPPGSSSSRPRNCPLPGCKVPSGPWQHNGPCDDDVGGCPHGPPPSQAWLSQGAKAQGLGSWG